MTREEIRTFPAGRELDKLVAEALGWTNIKDRSLLGMTYPVGNPPDSEDANTVPLYSENLTYTFNYLFDPMSGEKNWALVKTKWYAHHNKLQWYIVDNGEYDFLAIAWGETAPEAICRAFLIWKLFGR